MVFWMILIGSQIRHTAAISSIGIFMRNISILPCMEMRRADLRAWQRQDLWRYQPGKTEGSPSMDQGSGDRERIQRKVQRKIQIKNAGKIQKGENGMKGIQLRKQMRKQLGKQMSCLELHICWNS